MAWSAIGSLGTVGNNTTDQSSLALTTTADLEAGNVAVLILAVDNHQGSNIDEGAVSSVTDSAGNTWLKAAEFTSGQSAAQAGSTCSIWYTKASSTLGTGGTITANFTNNTSRDAQAMTVYEFSFGAGSTVSVQATNTLAETATTPGSLDATTPNAEFLRVRGFATESNSLTNITPTSSWTVFTNARSGGGAANINQAVRGEFIISTATGAASTPTAAPTGDPASVYVAFKETAGVAAGTKNFGMVIG